MFMHRLKELQEILDQGDPFLLEAYYSKTQTELLARKEQEMHFRKIALDRRKTTTDVDNNIRLLDALIEYREVKDALKNHDKMMDEGIEPVEGMSIT